MTTEASGNTNPRLYPKLNARAFQFTLNEINKYEALKTIITNLKSNDYFISCLEQAPTTGHEHIHIYAHFTTPYKISKRILDIGAHIEVCKGSPKQNIEYIRKDGNIIDEIGEAPHQGTIYTVKDLKEANIEDIPAHLYNIKKSIDSTKPLKTSEWMKTVKVYYISGPSGIGKSTKAYDLLIENNIEEFDEINYENGFYIGATGKAKACIFDDFRDSRMKPDEFIRFIDYRRHTMNIKGGQLINNYELIIITSIKSLDEIYRNVKEEQREQWIRRIEHIDLTPFDEDALV